MSSWEDAIAGRFVPEAADIWVIADQDALVRNEKVASRLIQNGFEILLFDDPLEFRYRYESGVRAAWDRGAPAKLVVVFEPDAQGFNRIPTDVLARAQRLDLSLSDIFPHLNVAVLRQLDPVFWARIYEADAMGPPMRSAKDTQDIVLRTCFEIDPTTIRGEPDLLRVLIRLHRAGQVIPSSLVGPICEALATRPAFRLWPLRELITESGCLWRFLQERWPRFVRMQMGMEAEPGFSVSSTPEQLPFAHNDVRVYVESLFREGILKPIDLEATHLPSPAPWWTVGLKRVAEPDIGARLREQRMHLREAIPNDTAGFRDWQQYLLSYSRHVADLFESEDGRQERAPFWQDLWPAVDRAFEGWFNGHYDALHTLPPSDPAVVHHAPKFLLREVKRGRRIALLVLDGLSLSQWMFLGRLLREELLTPNLVMEESTILTWVPTLTPVGRQSIFSGLVPIIFGATIDRTDRDGPHWLKFWRTEAGLNPSQIAHREFHGEMSEMAGVTEVLESAPIVIGSTLYAPDKIMHGASLGWSAMYAGLKLWMAEGFFPKMCRQLLEAGYEVYVSADHGNVEATGVGRLSEGVVAENQGDRMRRYQNSILRDRGLEILGEKAAPLNAKGLPDDYFALIAKGRGAFVSDGERIVCHGGLSVDELFVPWIRIAVEPPQKA